LCRDAGFEPGKGENGSFLVLRKIRGNPSRRDPFGKGVRGSLDAKKKHTLHITELYVIVLLP